MRKQAIAALIGIVGAVFITSGCAPLIVGGAAVTAGATVSTMTDRRFRAKPYLFKQRIPFSNGNPNTSAVPGGRGYHLAG